MFGLFYKRIYAKMDVRRFKPKPQEKNFANEKDGGFSVRIFREFPQPADKKDGRV